MRRETDRGSVIYVGRVYLPSEGAPGKRVYNVAQCLRESGFTVKLACLSRAMASDYQEIDGLHYFRTRRLDRNGSRLAAAVYWLSGRYERTAEWLNEALNTDTKGIVAYGGSSPQLIQISRVAKRFGVPVVPDIVEWDVAAPVLSLPWLDLEVRQRAVVPALGKAISISRVMRDYFLRRGCKAIHVPPIVRVAEADGPGAARSSAGRGVRLLFSGSPNRERHDAIIAGCEEIARHGLSVELIYCGTPTEEIARIATTREEGFRISAVGRLSEDDYADLIRAVDAGIIVRDDRKWSRSCFPSKVPEFLSVGTPVLCSRVGDLRWVVRDGREGFTFEGASAAGLASAIMSLARLSAQQRRALSESCRSRALQLFDSRRWRDPISNYIDSLR